MILYEFFFYKVCLIVFAFLYICCISYIADLPGKGFKAVRSESTSSLFGRQDLGYESKNEKG